MERKVSVVCIRPLPEYSRKGTEDGLLSGVLSSVRLRVPLHSYQPAGFGRQLETLDDAVVALCHLNQA